MQDNSLSLKIFIILIMILSACGYKPSAKYARSVMGEKISTSIYVSQTDPENSVIVKDAVDRAVIEVFHASLTDRIHSDAHLSLRISNPSYSALQYDSNGYVISYRARITLYITRETKSLRKNYTTTGTYDFLVDPNAVLTDQQRFEAIKYSSIKAISAFVAKVSAEGSREQ